jgi:hypothetical protein
LGARARAAIVLAKLVTVGCGNADKDTLDGGDGGADAADGGADAADGGADGAEAGAPVAAVDDFIDSLARAMCAWQFRCCSLAEIDAIGTSTYLTEADCIPSTVISLHTWFGDARASVIENRMALDPASAAACVADFAAGTCVTPSASASDPWARFQQCPDPFVGEVPMGARCFVRDECVPGSRCVGGGVMVDNGPTVTPQGVSSLPSVSSMASGIGSCIAYIQEGERCDVTVDCNPGLYCRSADSVCARPVEQGDPCEVVTDANNNSILILPCNDTVKTVICTSDVCARLPREGEPCLQNNGNSLCDPDPTLALSCVGIGIDGNGICKKPGQMGDACLLSFDRTGGLPPCDTGLTCTSSDPTQTQLGTCGPPYGLGVACPLGQGCLPPAVCDEQKDVCTTQGTKPEGEICTNDVECASLSCSMSSATGVCSGPPNPLGVRCMGQGVRPTP